MMADDDVTSPNTRGARDAADAAATAEAVSSGLKPHQLPRRTLPRRASTIRDVALEMARRRGREEGARQSVSDRIGYALAFLAGAVVMAFFGRLGVTIVGGIYALSAYVAYRRFERIVPPEQQPAAKSAKPQRKT